MSAPFGIIIDEDIALSAILGLSSRDRRLEGLVKERYESNSETEEEIDAGLVRGGETLISSGRVNTGGDGYAEVVVQVDVERFDMTS